MDPNGAMGANPYLDLTAEFNRGRLRCILSSGQAVVVHGLAVTSKDGDWLIREDQEACDHVVQVLARHRARYRFGAPLDPRWLAGGWSSHLEYQQGELRLRTDFVARPPRIAPERLTAIWREQEGRAVPVIDLPDLALLKMTNRDKDYPVIGEIARRVADVCGRLLLSRSPRDLVALASAAPELARSAQAQRPLLALAIQADRDALEAALDAERRAYMRLNEQRLARYLSAASAWKEAWTALSATWADQELPAAHAAMVAAANRLLPRAPAEAPGHG
jgi:hypothetical protein